MPNTSRISLRRTLLSIKSENELLVIDTLTILLILIIAFLPSNLLHAILGLPVALFFPGYTLLAAVFPKKDDLNTIERTILSLGLSMLVVALIGLTLNYAPWGLKLYPVLFSTTIFIIAASVVASFRRHRLPFEEHFDKHLGFSLSFNLRKWTTTSRLYKGLSIALALAILAVIWTFGHAITTTEVGERFTQFYILNADGKSENYPKELLAGEETKVIVEVVNYERETMSYRLKTVVDGIANEEIGPVALAPQEKWKREVSFGSTRVGENQKVEFLLYKQEQAEPYLRTYLWIDVRQSR